MFKKLIPLCAAVFLALPVLAPTPVEANATTIILMQSAKENRERNEAVRSILTASQPERDNFAKCVESNERGRCQKQMAELAERFVEQQADPLEAETLCDERFGETYCIEPVHKAKMAEAKFLTHNQHEPFPICSAKYGEEFCGQAARSTGGNILFVLLGLAIAVGAIIGGVTLLRRR